MDERRVVIAATASVIAVTTITILAVTQTPPPPNPADFNSVLLVSMDGFRADYRSRGFNPTLSRLAKAGVSTLYMKPSYPTLTFPNHYTIVTGLYPASHGIIANSFYDPEFNKNFTMSSNEGEWWWGEPIWNTLKRQGKRSATCFWPGSDSDINGTHPDHWYRYSVSEHMSYEARIDKVIEWLSLPNDTRPHWVSLYFDEPDHTAHEFGPETRDVDQKLARMDEILSRLEVGLRKSDLTDKVNVIVVADHGMVSAGSDKVIQLTDYVPNINNLASAYSGVFGRINFKDNANNATRLDVLNKLTCTNPALRAYAKEDLPKRFHFDHNRRIEDIVLDMDEGYIINTDESWSILGQHGYDNYFSTMNALFVAWGPDFKKEVTLEPFQNIELYNLMCHLLGITPAPNNGTEGSLNEALVDPPEDPDIPLDDDPPNAEYPNGTLNDSIYNMSHCPGLLNLDDTTWLEEALKFTEDEMVNLTSLHLPWGVPQPLDDTMDNASLLLLHHHSHVTGYSETLRMPLWTSLTLTPQPMGSNETDWSSDVRLEDNTTPTCTSYDEVNATMMPLFHHLLNTNNQSQSYLRIPYLASNAVAASFVDRWEDLLNLLLAEVRRVKLLNLLMGPVVDWSAVGDANQLKLPVIPTDLFAVATWCRNPTEHFSLCDSSDLRTYSFIYPQKEVAQNCLSAERYSIEFSGRVKDVEMATGFMFYPDLSFANRTRLELAIRPPMWLVEH